MKLYEIRNELKKHKKSTELLREIEAYLSFRICPDMCNMIKIKYDIVNHLNNHFEGVKDEGKKYKGE